MRKAKLHITVVTAKSLFRPLFQISHTQISRIFNYRIQALQRYQFLSKMSVKCMYSLLDKMLLSLSCSNLTGHVNQNAKGMKGISYNNIKADDVYPGNRKHASRYKPYRTTISRRYRKMARQPHDSENLDLMKKDINQLKSYKHTDKTNPLYRSLYAYKKSYYKFKCIDKKIRKSFHNFSDFEMNQLSRKVASFRLSKTSKDKIMWPPLYKYKGNIEKRPKPQTPHPQGSKRLILKLTTKSYPHEILQPLYPSKGHADTVIPNQVTVKVAELRKDVKGKEETNKDKNAVEKKDEESKKVSKEEVENLKMKIKLHKQSNIYLDSINRLCYKLENMTDKKPESIVHYLKSSLKKELDELKAVAPNKYRELMKENKFHQLKLDMHITSERLREITKDSSRLMSVKTESHKVKNKQNVISKDKDKDAKIARESRNEELSEIPASPAELLQSSNPAQSIFLTAKTTNKTTARAFSTHHFFDDVDTSLSLKIEEKPLDIALSREKEGKYASYINSNLNNKKVLKYMMEKHKGYLESKSKKDRLKSEKFKLDSKDFNMTKNCSEHKFLSVSAGREKMNIKLKEFQTRLKSYQSDKTSQPIFEAKNNMLQTTEQMITPVAQPEELGNTEIEHLKTETLSIPVGLFNSQGMSLLTTKRFYSTSPKVNNSTLKKIAENKMAYQPLYFYKKDITNGDDPSKTSPFNERAVVNPPSTVDRVNTRIKVNLDNLVGTGQIKINLEKMDDLKLGRTTIPTTSSQYLQTVTFPSKNEPLSKLKKNVLQLKKLIHEKLGKEYVGTNKIAYDVPYAITAPKKSDLKSLSSPTCTNRRTEINPIAEMTSPCICDNKNIEDNTINKLELPFKQESVLDMREMSLEEKNASDKLNAKPISDNEKSHDSWKMQIRETVFNNSQVDNSMINQRSGILLNHPDVSFPMKETGFFSGGLKLPPPCEFDGTNTANVKQDSIEAKECGSVMPQKNENNPSRLPKESHEQLLKSNTSPDAKTTTVSKATEKPVNTKLLQEMRAEVQKAYEKSLQDITSEVLKGSESQSTNSKDPKPYLESKTGVSSSDRSRCSQKIKRTNNNLRKIKSMEGVHNLFEELYDTSRKEVAQLTSRSLDRLGHKQYLSKFDSLMSRIADKIYNRDSSKNHKYVSKDDGKKNMSGISSKINSSFPPWMKSIFEKKKYSFNNSNVIDCRDKSNIKLEISGISGNVALNLTRDSKNGALQATLSLPNCVVAQNSNKEIAWLEKHHKAKHELFNKQNPKFSSLTFTKKENLSDAKEKDSSILACQKKSAASPNEENPTLKSSETDSTKNCTSDANLHSDQLAKKEEAAPKKEDTSIKSSEKCTDIPQPIKALKSEENVKVESCDKPVISKSEETLMSAPPNNKLEKNENVEKPKDTCPSKTEVTPQLSKSEVKLENVPKVSRPPEPSDKICPKASSTEITQEVKAELQQAKCSTDEKPNEPKKKEEYYSRRESSRPSSPLSSKTDIQECLPRTSIEKSTPMMSLCTVRPRIKPINPGKRKTRPIPSEDKSETCNNDMYMPPNIKNFSKTEECKTSSKKKAFNAAQIKASDIPNKMFHIQQPMLKCFIVPEGNLCPLTPEKSSSCSSLPSGCKTNMKNPADKKINNRKNCLSMAKRESEKEASIQRNVIYPRSRSKSPEKLLKYESAECKEDKVRLDEHEFENDFVPDIPNVTSAKSQVTLFDTKSISVTVPETDDFTKKLKLPCLSAEYEKTWYTEAGLNNTRPTSNNYYYKISDMFFPKM
ncbi:uncharacterized protein LOC112127792 [Cimex lectularius]|uniref:Uncharacterized protein n=1 Tax=Cimex lectularius TaxID=79782 RepID=A0A8I6SQH9_CIMLE|nr:uncharacterized protein LOC112127792 [Cimex lectularius]